MADMQHPGDDREPHDARSGSAVAQPIGRVPIRARSYLTLQRLLQLDLREQWSLLVFLARWTVIGSIVGVLAGLSSAFFLESLDTVTGWRETSPWLLWLLPATGLAIGLTYHYGAGLAARGNNLVIEEIHAPEHRIPRRMAPLVYAATIVTHLTGGSAGREGTAIQMSCGLADNAFGPFMPISAPQRRLLLVSGIAGGFGAVFGVPLAGCIFALEVQSVGRVRHGAIVPALAASVVGDRVVHALGVPHLPLPVIDGIDLDWLLALKVILAGLAFGLTAIVFAELTHGIRRVFVSVVAWPPARPVVGGFALIGLTYLIGTRDYLGLSLPLITDAVAGGVGLAAFAFALKLLFTAVTLGSGFQGGEVTPLFVIGATLGATLGAVLDAPVPLFAALGFVAVFAGATNTPIACIVMGIELFGAEAIVPIGIACVVSYTFTSHRGIYGSQRLEGPKSEDRADNRLDSQLLMSLSSISEGRRLWLPDRRS